ncbi:MAG: HDIG domain-containing protein [Ureaplasma sp.]|nr:HDIG domain-containing protein [Ureaplasma sp.]
MNTLLWVLLALLIILAIALIFCCVFFFKKTNKNQQPKKELMVIDCDTQRKYKVLTKQFYDDLKKEFQQNFIEYKNNLIISALENITYQNLDFKTFITVPCDNEEIKKKIIGKSARNRRIIENIAGIDLQISPNEPIKISSLNPFRREIGRRMIQQLVLANYIDQAKIEKTFERANLDFEKELYDVGNEVVNDILKFKNIDKGLYKYIGKLKYRLSYGQNNLMHSIECAQLAYTIADELGLDKQLAAQCAFFHDIGKAIDLDMQKSHVDLGVELAEKYKLDKTVILAIKSHHNDIIVEDIYCAIVKIVDKLSASRIAARNQDVEDFVKRAKEFELICKSVNYVSDAYVLKSCHEIRVIIKPSTSNEIPLEVIAEEIKEKIRNSNEYNSNFNIKIYLTKEVQYETNI